MKHKILQFLLYIFVTALPVAAQNHFVSVDWQMLPPLCDLPEMLEEIPLPDDFRSYTYQVDIEFPEFEKVDSQTADSLKKLNVILPDYPVATTDVAISAHKGFLNVRFLPLVYRDGHYQRINSFKLSLKKTPVIATQATAFTRTATVDNSVLSAGRFVKIRIPDTGVYQLTNAELRRMGFNDPEKVRIYGYGGYLLSNRFANHPCDDLPEVPIHRTANGLLFYAWQIGRAHV